MNLPTRFVSLGLFAFLSLPMPGAELSITDDFRLTGSARKSGATLDKAPTEKGGAKWETAPANVPFIVFSPEGYATPHRESGCGASIKVEDKAKVIQLSAALKPGGSDWTALVVGSDSLDTNFFMPTGGAITVLLRESGDYTIVARPHKPIIVAQGRLETFSASEFTPAELLYDVDANTLTVRFRGETVLQKADLSALDFQPVITRAGFRFNAPGIKPGVPGVDDFRLKIFR
jgi:hypothetical protein